MDIIKDVEEIDSYIHNVGLKCGSITGAVESLQESWTQIVERLREAQVLIDALTARNFVLEEELLALQGTARS